MQAVKDFLRRHFVPPDAWAIIFVGFLGAVVTGLIGAAVWTSHDVTQIKESATIPTPSVLPTSPPESSTTTTTRPDLTVDDIKSKIASQVWSVSTLDAAGQPSQASAFVVGSAGGQTFLITSLAAVDASTQEPGPTITASNDAFSGTATLWTWDDQRDLALLAVDRTKVSDLPWDNAPLGPKAGDKVFALSSGGDQQVSPGVITSVLGGVIQHNVFIDDSRRGGPLVNMKGEVIGVASAAFTGGGAPTDAAFFSVPIHSICGSLILCGGVNAALQQPIINNSSSTSSSSSAPARRQPATTTSSTEETPSTTAEETTTSEG